MLPIRRDYVQSVQLFLLPRHSDQTIVITRLLLSLDAMQKENFVRLLLVEPVGRCCRSMSICNITRCGSYAIWKEVA